MEVFILTEPNKLKRAVIKEELVALTGNVNDALVLNQMIYWSERVKDADSFIKEEMNKARKFSDGSVEDPEDMKKNLRNGWIYKSSGEMITECMLSCSNQTMGRIFDRLVDNGWLDKRRNPKYKWDKTWQYRVNLTNIQRGLLNIGYPLEGYDIPNFQNGISSFQNGTSNFQNGISSFQNGIAIPETTPETTNLDTYKETYKETGHPDPICPQYNYSTQANDQERDTMYKESLQGSVPDPVYQTLLKFSNNYDEMYNWVGLLFRAKNQAEKRQDQMLMLENENIALEVNRTLMAGIRAIRRNTDIEKPDNYLFMTLFNGFEKIVQEYKQVNGGEPNHKFPFYNWLEQ